MTDMRDMTHTSVTSSKTELDRTTLLELRQDPPSMGELGAQARERHFGQHGRLRNTPALDPGRASSAYLERDGELIELATWPDPKGLQEGDALALALSPDDDGASAWVDYLFTLSERSVPLSVAPFTVEAAGTFRLWALASARLALPAHHRVEARHDLIGIRLAQVGIGFGADTLAGPVDEDRHLPLAGITRPNETTRSGLEALMTLCGLIGEWTDATQAPAPRPAAHGPGPSALPTAAPSSRD